MDLHRLAEERSVAYHGVIARRLRSDPSILARARSRVDAWTSTPGHVPFYASEWQEILATSTEKIAAFLVERSERADEMRQSSPFAGAITAAERWQIWREVGARCGAMP